MKYLYVIIAMIAALFIAYMAMESDSNLGLASIFDVYFLAYIAGLYTAEFLRRKVMDSTMIYVLISFFSWGIGFSMALALVMQMINKEMKKQMAPVKTRASVRDLNPTKYED